MNLWAKLPLNLAADKTITASAKVVYAILLYHCNSDSSCYPGMRTLIKECGIANQTVQDAVSELEQLGYITIDRIKEEGKNARNIYTLTDKSVSESSTLSSVGKKIKAYQKIVRSVPENSTDAYQKIVQKEIDQGKRGDAHPEKKKTKKPKTKFIKPTTDQIREYAKEINFIELVNHPQKFLNYYQSKGWKVGKTPMKCWKATVRTWQDNERGDNKIPAQQQNGSVPDAEATKRLLDSVYEAGP